MEQAPNTPDATDQLAQKGYKRAKNDRAWDWLNDLHGNIRNAMTVPATLLPFLRDDALADRVQANGDIDTLTKLGQLLVKDCQAFFARFQELHAAHAGKSGATASADELIEAISLGQAYTGFMDEYNRIILPTVIEMLDIFEKAGLNTGSIRPDAEKGLSYDLLGEGPTTDVGNDA